MTMVVSGYTETNCFLSYTIFHLTGGSAILKCRVKDVLNDLDGSRCYKCVECKKLWDADFSDVSLRYAFFAFSNGIVSD
ncbi:odorant receptor 13a-like [Vespula maculifrons]|uniref:Odorant receptor 13a-like n=1 Tax=Vespula maculifrons TaxID=7453 RepID=A0ABD2BPE6_VESMC